MSRNLYVLLNGQGLPYVSVKRGEAPLIGTCADIASAKKLMAAHLAARKSGNVKIGRNGEVSHGDR